jgi:hypothetical protein
MVEIIFARLLFTEQDVTIVETVVKVHVECVARRSFLASDESFHQDLAASIVDYALA